MPQIIAPTTLPADGSYVELALNSLYSAGYLLLTGNVDMIMQYAPMTGQQQDMSFLNLPGGQYSLSPGTKNLITGFKLRAPGGATGSTVQYSLAMFEPTIPSIIPAGGGALGPFRSQLQPLISAYQAVSQAVPDGGNWTFEWSWEGPGGGLSDLFDLTVDPTAPRARQSGLYGITVNAIPRSSPVPTAFWTLTLDTNSSFVAPFPFEGFASSTWPFQTVHGGYPQSPWGTASLPPWPIPAGQTFDTIVTQNTGAGPINFNALAYVTFIPCDISLTNP